MSIEPIALVCRLTCPKDGQKAYVRIQSDEAKGCCVTSCSLLREEPTCDQGCLDSHSPPLLPRT
jgi:hypothetical protein